MRSPQAVRAITPLPRREPGATDLRVFGCAPAHRLSAVTGRAQAEAPDGRRASAVPMPQARRAATVRGGHRASRAAVPLVRVAQPHLGVGDRRRGDGAEPGRSRRC